MPVQSIPPEILNLVIEITPTIKKTLFACSLVSKSWLQLTRFRLFGDLTLHLGGSHEARFLALCGVVDWFGPPSH
ncbi:hypothetical protein K438DRAFT_1822893 [Mycena galopus ATCC 62051]|nr:hypothetical protein K438DRAFT_1822893 [Mycena galopus ATCC 62051]